ncbi:Uncharacterized protein BP5553_09676 [Venustampulla echinocandica]|uniref:ADP-ribosylation factor GTPase-activating protein GCS1 n=1 Tax=Venustampulla echinocandica TaxID=2656787 RepID=A0A370TBQ3_9HELO|nr:Uncharacterized protein BP5553_09676 [Venustampulla echinocandica]RDL31467.1 Uncharacterized protein BP5553_09676 [Venustampulla echinocandica]
MDAFKAQEIERMRLGGNRPWRDFFDDAEANKFAGITWDDATIAERYSGEVGEEWKERLSAKVEGKEYVPSVKPAATSMSFGNSSTNSRSQTPLGSSRTDSPSRPGGKAKVDDKYFAGLGAANASRPHDLPPSQGGKYGGFGSAPPEPARGDPKLPGFDDLQKDPVAALTKGFGWFTSTVGKTAKTVNEGYIQPTAAKIAETDLAAQARVTAGQVARGAQTGAKNAADGFNRFVEGNGSSGGAYRQAPIDESKKDFWDSFAEAGNSKPSAIGTSAVKKGGSSAGLMGGAAKKDEDNWDKW